MATVIDASVMGPPTTARRQVWRFCTTNTGTTGYRRAHRADHFLV